MYACMYVCSTIHPSQRFRCVVRRRKQTQEAVILGRGRASVPVHLCHGFFLLAIEEFVDVCD